MKAAAAPLFPTTAAELQWAEFPAAGFPGPVSGVIYRTGKPPCCGVPVGGLGTGCVDIDARGIYGFSTFFNPMSFPPHHSMHRMPRKLPRLRAVLGLSTGGKTWVMATRQVLDGEELEWCMEPYGNDGSGKIKPARLSCPKVEGVEAVKEIHYWGHYPVVDMEYETDAPVGVGMRVWAPFIPGDAAVSNTPGAVFEVHVRNLTGETQAGTVALNFPGPDAEEARGNEFLRQDVREDVRGVQVVSAGGVGYFLGVIGEEVRTGGGLHVSGKAWSRMGEELPKPRYREDGGRRWYPEGESSAAVDFKVGAGEEKVVRFVLAWYAPVREGQTKSWPEKAG